MLLTPNSKQTFRKLGGAVLRLRDLFPPFQGAFAHSDSCKLELYFALVRLIVNLSNFNYCIGI